MTINDLIFCCKNINSKTAFSIYESAVDFELATSRFETYENYKAMPAYIKAKEVAVFEISRQSNTCFIGIAK